MRHHNLITLLTLLLLATVFIGTTAYARCQPPSPSQQLRWDRGKLKAHHPCRKDASSLHHRIYQARVKTIEKHNRLIKQAFENEYRNSVRLKNKIGQCLNRDYSNREVLLARCRNRRDIRACFRKLLGHCYRREYMAFKNRVELRKWHIAAYLRTLAKLNRLPFGNYDPYNAIRGVP